MLDLQDVSDRTEIMDLHLAYAQSLDTKDWALLRTVFTDDAVADFWVGGKAEGIEEIVALCDGFMSKLDATHHAMTNHQIQVTGDTAAASVYLIAGHLLKGVDGTPHCIVRGHYHDALVRTRDGWRITSRVLTVDWSEGNVGVLAAGATD